MITAKEASRKSNSLIYDPMIEVYESIETGIKMGWRKSVCVIDEQYINDVITRLNKEEYSTKYNFSILTITWP